MPRGRRAQPDEIKALRGNPGKRKLALENPERFAAKLKPVAVEIPDFLTEERERRIFCDTVGNYLQNRVARETDLIAYARWAVYVSRWLKCKEHLSGKTAWIRPKAGAGGIVRRHPAAKDLLDIERILQALEDRLGLNPVARQNIFRGLSTMPAALGGLVAEDGDKQEDQKEQNAESKEDDTIPLERGPLGFMQKQLN